MEPIHIELINNRIFLSGDKRYSLASYFTDYGDTFNDLKAEPNNKLSFKYCGKREKHNILQQVISRLNYLKKTEFLSFKSIIESDNSNISIHEFRDLRLDISLTDIFFGWIFSNVSKEKKE